MKLFLPTFFASVAFLSNFGVESLNVKLSGINYTVQKGPAWVELSEKCKTLAEVEQDLEAIKKYTNKIRIPYSPECNQADLVLPAAKKVGLQVELGIWTAKGRECMDQEKKMLTRLIDSGAFDKNVVCLHVGSGAVTREEFDDDTAVSYLLEIREHLAKSGFETPLTITEDISVYEKSPQLLSVVDFISISLFTYWNPSDINEAASFTYDRLKGLRMTAAPLKKPVELAETGWSSQGVDARASVSNPANQAKFLADLFYVFSNIGFPFSWYLALDSPWRTREVEANFGLFTSNQTLKSHIEDLTIEEPKRMIIENTATKLVLSVFDTRVYIETKSTNALQMEEQMWSYNATSQQFRSQDGRALDAYEPEDGGDVHTFRSLSTEGNQKWKFEKETGLIKHQTHAGFCLEADQSRGNRVQLFTCSTSLLTASQTDSLTQVTITSNLHSDLLSVEMKKDEAPSSNLLGLCGAYVPNLNYIVQKGPTGANSSDKCRSMAEIVLYSAECDQAESVLFATKKAGLQVQLGI
ncbi:hypothetical protein CCR75_009503 [Bremia lactucae]|uniref:glucan endo-1,3-beta-D-glucosidase n=1 Tax=Bremia lactucae TaxID=4779 RepID=A0A976FN56_BRELC|nr:hypothetical protein CCR75_009503 [Bremia lactucae]